MLPLILLLAACGCPSFDEMRIVDATDAGLSAERVDAIQGVIDWFDASTGLDGACVDRVVVQDEVNAMGRSLQGFYNPTSQTIRVRPRDAAQTTVHELCHAVDRRLGDVSLDRPDLFDPDTVANPDLYRSENSRIREVFAEHCEFVQLDDTLQRAVHEQCGVPWSNPEVDWFRDVIFPTWTPPVLAVDFTPLPDPEVWEPFPSTQGLPWRALANTDRELVVGWHPRGPGHDPTAFVPLQLDFSVPWSDTPSARVDLDLGEVSWLRVMPGPDVVVVLSGDAALDRVLARLVGPDGVRATYRLPSALTDFPWWGFLDGEGRLWLGEVDRQDDPDGCGLVVWDLEAGGIDSCPPSIGESGGRVQGPPIPGPNAPVFPVDPTGDGDIVLVEPRTGARYPTPTRHRLLAVAGDGDVWSMQDASLFDDDLGALARWQGDGSRVTVDSAICLSPTPPAQTVLSIAGGAWVLQGSGVVDDPLVAWRLPL
ncbi:MAG: hypothetical protein H6742_15985 [Alphaproteobacteria bacterium]|nr:hypothetical protein [Alphaproteobacteria bacterium]